MDILSILQFPFMQRALIAGVVLGLVLAYLGIFVVLKRMSFFGDGVAHASLAGVAIGVITGFYPLYTALIFSVVLALLIYVLEKKTNLPSDAVIGILFASGMATGVMLMSMQSGYQPELLNFLFGNILAISSSDIVVIIPLALLLAGLVGLKQREITLLSLNPEIAYLSGVNTGVYQPLFYVFLAVAVVLGIKIVGVILVSALLIIPVSTAKLVTGSFKSLVSVTIITSLVVVLSGISLSYYLDLPTGPTMVLSGVFLFIAALIWRFVFAHNVK